MVSPERIKGKEFPLGFMLAVMFYLGFIYNTGHYFLYREPGHLIYYFYAGSAFWIHSIFGGVASAGNFLLAGVVCFLGARLLGKHIPYRRVEHWVFCWGPLVGLLPLLFGILLIAAGLTGPWGGVKAIKIPLFDYGVSCSVLITGAVALLVAFRTFNRGAGLSKLKSMSIALLLVPCCYLLPKKGFFVIVTKIHESFGILSNYSSQWMMGVVIAATLGLTCYVVRYWICRMESTT